MMTMIDSEPDVRNPNVEVRIANHVHPPSSHFFLRKPEAGFAFEWPQLETAPAKSPWSATFTPLQRS